jgi:DNA replication protein DnaC
LFISVSKYFIALKDSISNQSDYITHRKNNILDADLVIFDDLATKVGTTFELENLLSIIDTRINFGKSNIYTSNVTGNDLRERIGDRLYSRVIHTSENIEFFGSDKRGMT